MRWLSMFLLVPLTMSPGCDNKSDDTDSDSESTGAAGVCDFIVGKEYRTVELFDCGPPAGDPECPRAVEFRPPDRSHPDPWFLYFFSDFGDGGAYTCSGNEVTGYGDFATYHGTIDLEAGEMVWDDLMFVLHN